MTPTTTTAPTTQTPAAAHQCDERCSWTLTPERLTAMGFTLEQYGKVCGCTILLQKGMSFGAARRAAWEAGLTRLCTKRPGR